MQKKSLQGVIAMKRPDPKEIKLSDVLSIYSKTDLRGNITYCNSYFTEVSGYTQEELIGSPHNIIRHPDMPRVIFKLMWERLKQHKDILAVIKNRAKNGDYYWVTTLFEIKYYPFEKQAEGYLAIRKAAPRKAVEAVIPLYKKLIQIEHRDGIRASQEYLDNYFKEKNTDYDTYMKELVEDKGLTEKFFNTVKKIFT